MINLENTQHVLLETLDDCYEAGLSTPEELIASPLKDKLMTAMYCWADFAAKQIAAHSWHSPLHGRMDPSDVAGDWLEHFWHRGRSDERPYPALRRLLQESRDPLYAMRFLNVSLRNRMLYRERMLEREDRMTGGSSA